MFRSVLKVTHNDPQIAEGGALYHKCLIEKVNLI